MAHRDEKSSLNSSGRSEIDDASAENFQKDDQPNNNNTDWMASALSESGCLTLAQILGSFSAPISEEQAWAVAHQSVKALQTVVRHRSVIVTKPHDEFYVVKFPDELVIHQDGVVTIDSFKNKSTSKKHREPLTSESKAIADLGMVIFTALDYGLKEDEERNLSHEVENLLKLMTSEDPAVFDSPGSDEGIQDDSRFQTSGICQKILDTCRQRLASRTDVDLHYRAVCRALVMESLELTSFVEKIRSFEEVCDSEELRNLAQQDWARIWVQVMRDLRTGVQLKKVDFSKTSVEFELTPYEILMDDIRSRRYKLNKVEMSQRTKNDAHDIILEFIRSRPPLKPASERVLPPLRKESTPVELLMEDIRSSEGGKNLRKTGGPPSKGLLMRLGSSSGAHERSRTTIVESDEENQGRDLSPRRKVTVDPSTLSHLLNFSDSDDDFDKSREEVASKSESSKRTRRRISVSTLLSRQTSVDSQATVDDDFVYYAQKKNRSAKKFEQNDRNLWQTKVARDLALHAEASPLSRNGSFRCHNSALTRSNSIAVCETPSRSKKENQTSKKSQESPLKISFSKSLRPNVSKADRPQKIVITPAFPSTTESTPSSSRASSAVSTPTKEASFTKIPGAELSDQELINKPQMHANLHAEFMQSEHWATALQTLDLTLDEVIHIRSVLTKAELEGLPLDGPFKKDVEKGKVCFLCMKSRFGFFCRGHKCELCKQQVCNKCVAKMRIPLDHFSTTPVFALSGHYETITQNTLPTTRKRGVSTSAVPRGSWNSNTAGSAPTSPVFSRKFSSAVSSGPASLMPPIEFQESQLMASSLTSFAETEEEDEYYGAKSLNSGPSSLQPIHKESRFYFGRTKKKSSDFLREKIQGRLRTICTDCREMVLQVIRAQTTARRLQMAKSIFQRLNNNS